MLLRIKERIQNKKGIRRKWEKNWKYIFRKFGNAKENSKDIAVHVEYFLSIFTED